MKRALGAAATLALLVGLAAFLRIYGLSRESLWLDEAATWWNATRESWRAAAFAEPNHAPLWWLVTRAFVLLFGDGESALRAPAALLGVLSVPLAWLVARGLLDPGHVPAAAGFRGSDAGAPAWIALLAAIHPYWLEYAQEARMYAALLAASLGLSLLYLSWLRSRRRRWLVWYALLAALGLYTHHFAALTLLAHAAFALIQAAARRRRGDRISPLPLLAAQACAITLFLPWLVRTLLSGAPPAASQGHFGVLQRLAFAWWRLMLGPSLATADRPRVDAGPLALLREEAAVLFLGAAVCGLCLLLGALALRRDRAARNFVLASILVPMAVLVAVFPRLPLLHEKYLIATAPFLLMLAVVGARSAPGLLRPALLAGLLALTLLGGLAYVFPSAPFVSRLAVHGHPWGKEQWREARAWVAGRAGPGDAVLLYPGYLHLPWDYYDRGRLAAVRLDSRPASAAELARAAAGRPAAHKVFLITASTRARDREAMVRDLARWTAPFAAGADTSGLGASRLFPRHWGVWAYEFAGPARR